MENLQKYFTIIVKGIKYVPTIEDRKYTYRLYYSVDELNLDITYPIIKEEYTTESWKIIRDSIKEDFKCQLKRKRVELKRKELFGV